MDAFQAAKIKARFEAHAAKRALKAKMEDPNESVEVFWERFKVRQESVTKLLDGILAKKNATTPKSEVEKLIAEVDHVFPKIDEIQHILSTSAMFLPGFDRRTANTKISKMKQRTKDVKEQLEQTGLFSIVFWRICDATTEINKKKTTPEKKKIGPSIPQKQKSTEFVHF